MIWTSWLTSNAPDHSHSGDQKGAAGAVFLTASLPFRWTRRPFAGADLHVDDEIDLCQVEELRRKSDTRRAIDRALDILALRDHAAGEPVPEALPQV